MRRISFIAINTIFENNFNANTKRILLILERAMTHLRSSTEDFSRQRELANVESAVN